MKREPSRHRKAFAALAAAATLLAACGGDDASETTNGSEPAPEAGGTDGSDDTASADSAPIRVGLQVGPPSLDPTSSPAAAIPQVLLYNVYETLVRLTPEGEIEPLLAESYEVSDDSLTYTFELHDGVTFHDGQELGADDVVYSITNVLEQDPPHPFRATLEPIDSVTAVDDLTVEIQLSRPSANMLFFLTQGQGIIFDAEGAGDLASSANGTGPFVFESFEADVSVELSANDQYWGTPAKAPSIEYRVINDENALTNAMLAGDLDIVPNVPAPELLTAFEQDDSFVVETGETYGEITMAVNGDNEPLDDVKVRQALTHAIDSEAIVDLSYGGYGTTIGTFSTPLDPYFQNNNDAYPYDPDRARELLDEAGVSDLTLSMKPFPSSYANRAAEIIQSQLAEVGVTVEITTFEAPAGWLDTVFEQQDYDLSIVAHVEPNDLAQYANPDYYWGDDSPEVADLIAEADAEADPEVRNELYREALDVLTEQAADVWLYVLPSLAVTTDAVSGFEVSALVLPMADVSVAP